MREKDVEADLVQAVSRKRGAAYKFVSPGRRGVPDRLVLMPIPEEHRELVARYVRFVEVKAPKGEVSGQQEKEHERLRKLGYRVEVSHDPLENTQALEGTCSGRTS